MARFIIADLTDPEASRTSWRSSSPPPLSPFKPILLEGQTNTRCSMDLKRRHHWVLEPYRYDSPEQLMADLGERVIGPAETKALELCGVKPETKGSVANGRLCAFCTPVPKWRIYWL